jgi:hypothetical protein
MANPIQPGIDDSRSRALLPLIDRLSDLDLSRLLVYRLDEDMPEDALLRQLIWQFHVTGHEGGSLAVTAQQRLDLVRRAIDLHRYRGTRWSVQEALAAIGYPGAGSFGSWTALITSTVRTSYHLIVSLAVAEWGITRLDVEIGVGLAGAEQTIGAFVLSASTPSGGGSAAAAALNLKIPAGSRLSVRGKGEDGGTWFYASLTLIG